METKYKHMSYKKILRVLKRKPRMRFLRSIEFFEKNLNRSRYNEDIFIDIDNKKIMIW